MSSIERLILVDASSYLYRAYYALPDLTGANNQPTGAIYGVLKMLKALDTSYPSNYFGVVFDPPGKTFRHDIFPKYKSHRPPTPDDLAEQFETLWQIIDALGYPLLQYKGVESDDVIGTLAKDGQQKKINVLISTGDKDLAQLVSEYVCLIDTMKKDKADMLLDSADAVIKKFGIAPHQIADYLALCGDASDGIPGVPSVGPKTAVKWLNTYGSLTGIINNAQEISTKAGEALRKSIPELDTYRQLTTIDCNLSLDHTADELVRKEPDMERLIGLYQECEFRSLLRDLDHPSLAIKNNTAEKEVSPYRLILTTDTLKKYVAKIKKAKHFAFDIATDNREHSNQPTSASPVGIALALADNDAVYIPLTHNYDGVPQQLSFSECMTELNKVLTSDKYTKCVDDIKTTLHMLANYDIKVANITDDSMLESYVYDSVATDHSIAQTALKYLGIETTRYENIAGKGVKQKLISHLAVKTAGDYMAQRADMVLRSDRFFKSKLKEDALTEVYQQIDLPLVSILMEIERKGVRIDEKALQKQSKELGTELETLEQEIYHNAGMEFNIASPKQIQKVLYEKAELPVLKKTPKGQPSTAEDVLHQLAADHILPRLILQHRAKSKLKSTYTDTLPKMVNSNSGRIHTTYHQAVTATGRLSSSNPNLQNIPIRNPEGRRIRQAFIPDEGYKLVAIDYSQIEMRVMAHLSGDETLVAQFIGEDDIHTMVAAEVFGISIDKVDGQQRRVAKAINFGLIYGMSAYGLARQLDIENKEAADYVERYFARYPAVKKYMQKTRELAHEQGYVETIFGRRLYLPDIRSKNPVAKRYAERTAINAPVQGSASDIIKKAMIAIYDNLPTGAMMIMQVHDELVFEVAQDQVDETVAYCSKKMTSAADLNIPLTVAIGIGDNWDEAH